MTAYSHITMDKMLVTSVETGVLMAENVIKRHLKGKGSKL